MIPRYWSVANTESDPINTQFGCRYRVLEFSDMDRAYAVGVDARKKVLHVFNLLIQMRKTNPKEYNTVLCLTNYSVLIKIS